MTIKKKVLLIGTGMMASEYTKILNDLSLEFQVVGNSEIGCKNFQEKTGIIPFSGGIEKYFLMNPNTDFKYAIVAVSVNQLTFVTNLLLDNGFKNILTEKPASLNKMDIKLLSDSAVAKGAHIYVAYNRRHYASVIKSLEIIKEDGGVLSFNFEFTEWSHVIKKYNHPPQVQNRWLLVNSTHVIDLAFFVAGKPHKLDSYSKGELDWSSCKAIHCGAGISDTGALFTYNANWLSPGRWGVEWLTPLHRLILKPLEKLQIQEIGSNNTTFVEIDDTLDIKYKPGLYKQVMGFLDLDESAHKRLKSISEQLEMMDVYEKIANQVF